MQKLTSPLAAAVLTMFLWSTTTIVVRFVREDMPPIGLSFWRTSCAFLILLPFAIAPLRSQWPMVRAHLKLLAVLAIMLWVGGNALLFLSLQYTIAINAAVINSVEPLFIVLFAALIFRDRFSWLQGAGLTLSLFGVLVLISAGSFEKLLRLNFNRGDLIVTCAYASWGLYVVFLRKVPAGLDHRLLLAALLGLGALFMLPLYLAETAFVRPFPFSIASIGTILGLAIFPGVLSMLMWNYTIKNMGGARAGQFIHLIPAFTVGLAIVFLDETLRQFHIIGMILVAAGLVIASRR
jgi:drug/metabolite transporter (DMT)-like permease